MKLIIGDKNSTYLAASQAHHCENLKAALEIETHIDWILFNNTQTDTTLIDSLKILRQHPRTCLTPIFCEHASDNFIAQQLIDGAALSLEAMNDSASTINDYKSALAEHIDYQDEEFLFLAYLFTRRETEITFFLDPQFSQVIRYPLIEAFISDKKTALARIFSMAQEGLLQSTNIKDELQVCAYCESALINFKNTCPECTSVDIKKQRFLHCFSCGNTEPEAAFLKKELLICPRCNNKLSHIGMDYDRPLEEHVCQSCKHSFVEPSVTCQCLTCQKMQLPSELISRKLSGYTLSDKGYRFVRDKNHFSFIDLKDENNFFDPSFFSLFLEWMINSSVRHDNITFSLLTLSAQNHEQMIQTYGIVKTRHLYTEFFQYLRKQIRTTDISTRFQDEAATILFAQSNSSVISIVEKKLREFITSIQPDDREKIDINIQHVSSDEIDLQKYDAKLLLAELNTRLIDTNNE